MIQSIIHKILRRRHFWRYATFSEIAELYASRTIRVIALNIVSGFTSVYLYSEGYSLVFIMLFWTIFHFLKVPTLALSALIIARYGPKHGMLYSNLLYVPAMISLGLLNEFGIWAIVIWAVFLAFSTSLYQIGYSVDFSKVKNIQHAGKELAFMNILEKIAIGISPIVGGLIALWFGLNTVIWVDAVLFLIAAIPLFKTAEPVETRQKFNIVGFPWRANARSLIAHLGKGYDILATGVVWSLFLVIVVFPGYGWEIYVKLGLLSSVTIITALIASYSYGRIIDRDKGGDLLIISTVFNSLVHIMRIFVNSATGVVATNITNEIATTGYGMSFMRGVFDAADLSGHRILYLCLADIMQNIGAAMAAITLLITTSIIDVKSGFTAFFIITAIFVLLIGTAKFKLYDKKSSNSMLY